jgi:hypothetical protein
LGLATVTAAVLSSQLAVAAPRRVLLLPFEGPSASEVQAVITSSLASDVTLLPTEQAERAAQLLATRPENGDDAYAALARRLRAVAVIEGKVVKDDRWRLRLSVRQGNNGTVTGAVAWSGAKIKEMVANVQRGAPYWLQSMLDAAEGVPSTRPMVTARAVGADTDDRPGSASASVRSSAAPNTNKETLWEISAGPRVLARTFTYTDDVAGLPGYTLAGAPALAVEGTLFPTAGSNTPTKNFGFAGHFETSLAVKTVGRDTSSHATTLQAYWVGGRYRLASNNFLFNFGLDYGEHRFNMDVQDATPPNVRYTFIRPSVSARADAGGGLALSVTLAYLGILSVGDLGREDRFPRDSAVGAEVDAGLGYTIDENFEVKFVADLRHYAHTMHAKMGDTYAVGGALDEHFGATLLVAYHSK